MDMRGTRLLYTGIPNHNSSGDGGAQVNDRIVSAMMTPPRRRPEVDVQASAGAPACMPRTDMAPSSDGLSDHLLAADRKRFTAPSESRWALIWQATP